MYMSYTYHLQYHQNLYLLMMCFHCKEGYLDKNILLKALERNNFKDFEDCIQDECASVCKVDFIVTRNVKDFETSTVKAISPDEFMDEYNKTLS